MPQDQGLFRPADALEMSTKAIPDTESDAPQDTQTLKNDPGTETKGLQTGLLMTALCLSVFLAALDITIVTTALPTISEHFHSTSGYVWVGSAFLLASAASTPNWGKFSDIWGRKVVLQTAAAVFFLGSALCGASVSLPMLIAGRSVQGAGAGGLLSMVNIIIGDLFSQRDRGKYYGIIGMVWAIAAALGPVIGGALTNNVSWRWCFYINLPVTGVLFVIIALTLKIHTPKTPLIAGIKAVDWLGSLTIAGGTLMLLLGLQLGGGFRPWGSATVICLLVFAVVTLAIFAVVEWRVARYPVLPLHLFADRSNIATLLVNFFHGIVFTQASYFLPIYFQSVLGASPLLSGVWILPFAIAVSLTAVAAGGYIKATGRYLDPIRLGLLLTVLGSGLFLYFPARSASWARLATFQIIAGVGVGANFQPPLIALQSNVPAQDNAAATASFGLVRNVASAVAVVAGSAAFAGEMAAQQDVLRRALGDRVAALLSGANAQGNLFVVGTLDAAQREVVRRAFFNALRHVWIESVCFAAAGLVACLVIRNRKLDREHVEVKTGLEGEEARRKIVEERRMGEKKNGSSV